jgi:hypothetical protein
MRGGLLDSRQGWVAAERLHEGQNVLIETRWGEGKTEDFPRIASELVAPVDVIVTSGPEAIRAVQVKTYCPPKVREAPEKPSLRNSGKGGLGRDPNRSDDSQPRSCAARRSPIHF